MPGSAKGHNIPKRLAVLKHVIQKHPAEKAYDTHATGRIRECPCCPATLTGHPTICKTKPFGPCLRVLDHGSTCFWGLGNLQPKTGGTLRGPRVCPYY